MKKDIFVIAYLLVSALCGTRIHVTATIVTAILKSGSTDPARASKTGCFYDAFGSWSERKRWISAVSVTKISKKKVN